MKISSKKAPAFLFGILITFMAFLMIGPRVPDNQQKENSIYNIDLPGPFGFSLNGDSPYFLYLARYPEVILHEKNIRQDRPGFIMLASAIAKIFPLQDVDRPVLIVTRDGDALDMLISYLKYYISYVLINIFILFGAFSFFSYLVCKEKCCYFVELSDFKG